MFIKLVNGVRDGTAIIMTKEYEFIKLTYQNGEMTGEVEKMDRYFKVLLSGFLVNGEEKGVFVEYNHGTPVWRGYYRIGKRFSEVVKSDSIRHFYEERSVKNQFLLSIAKYDDSLRDKNGRCFEFENGTWVGESLYENGVRVKSIRDIQVKSIRIIPVSTPNASSLSTTGVSVYNSIISLISHSSLVVYDLNSTTEYGVIQANDHWYAMKWSEEENYVINADCMTHEMRFCEDDHWIECTASRGIIDLDSGGR